MMGKKRYLHMSHPFSFCQHRYIYASVSAFSAIVLRFAETTCPHPWQMICSFTMVKSQLDVPFECHNAMEFHFLYLFAANRNLCKETIRISTVISSNQSKCKSTDSSPHTSLFRVNLNRCTCNKFPGEKLSIPNISRSDTSRLHYERCLWTSEI